MHSSLEPAHSLPDLQTLRQQVEALRDEVENLSRQGETGGLDVDRLHHAGQLSHQVSLALFSLQQQEMERIRQERDVLKKDYLEQARRERRFEGLDLAQLQATSAGPVELLE